MPQTPAGSGHVRASSTADRSGGSSRTKSCLTIQLPDISTNLTVPVSPLQQPVSDSSRPRQDKFDLGNAARAWQAKLTPVLKSLAASSAAQLQQTTHSLRRLSSGPLQRTTDTVRTKVIPFVCQPKFWLACITAVAVQVVLAMVMAPAEDEAPERVRTAANRWPEPAAAPAERIVVPPAQASQDPIVPKDSGKQGTTTPLGVAAPLDSSEAAGAAEQMPVEAGLYEPPQVPRMAENRRLTEEGRQFDGLPASEADGATLGGIVPLEPLSERNLHEPQR